MRRRLLLAALLAAAGARGDGLFVTGVVGYEGHDNGRSVSSGLRQTYDLRLDKALTRTSLVRLFIRGDDFQGRLEDNIVRESRSDHTRQIQPIGEFLMNVANVQAAVRSERLDTRGQTGTLQSSRNIDRDSAHLSWTPERLPRIDGIAQRTHTADGARTTDLTEQSLGGQLDYAWRGLSASVGQRFTQSTDQIAGYDRRTVAPIASINYNQSALAGRLIVNASGMGQVTRVDEQALDGKGTLVPTPVTPSRALWAIDDTPQDDRDHPLASVPALIDGNLAAASGISLGPDSVSFQNIAIDIGRIDKLDEIRLVVRDSAGRPPRLGGGPVSWDAYTSDDGVLWAPLANVQSTFNAALSLYSISFPQTSSRWFKVVNFGLNGEETLVTELQAYNHTRIAPGGQRSGTERSYTGATIVAYQPISRLTLTYSGVVNAFREDVETLPRSTSTNLEHHGLVEYHVRSWLGVRGELTLREVHTTGTISGSGGDGRNFYLDFTPTRRLTSTLELSRQTESVGANAFTLDTRAVHTSAYVYRALMVNADAGIQTQTLLDGSTSRRQFFDLTSAAQLLPTVRALVTGSIQRNRSDGTGAALDVLGPERDNRLSTQVSWRPGNQLTLMTTLTWSSSTAYSGLTEQFHIDWRPFGDGTVSIAASIDQDVDPVQNRRARRVLFNPRWVMNRWAFLDLNYTSVGTTSPSSSNLQRNIYATITLTR